MSQPPPDDDPTHALDDFVRRMRPAAVARASADDPTSLACLQARLHPEHAGCPSPWLLALKAKLHCTRKPES